MTRVAVLLLCACTSAGCLTSDLRVMVRPDGSGTVRYTMKVSPSRMAEMEKLFPSEPGARPRPPVESLFTSDPRFASGAAGPEVRLVSSHPLKSLDSVGREITFEFDDVSKVQPELLPSLPGGLGAFYSIAAAESGVRARLAMNLSTTSTGNALLTVRFPKFAMDPSAEPPGASATGTPAEMAQLRNAVKGTRLTITVETATPVIRTNTPHHDGTEVTLVDVDVESALFSRQIDMLRATPASFDEYLSMLGDLPGVTLASDRVITIEFQGTTPPSQPTAQAPPSTEIYLAPIETRGDRITLGAPVNISNSPGYDNQPSFTPDGGSILFTSGRGGVAARGSAPATDIYRYDIAARRTVRVTDTPESEYSPAVTPDGKRFTVIRVEADTTQRLWSFGLDGQNPAVVLADIKPVGYHAWIDEHRLALFVLGQDRRPSTLQVADIRTGKAEVVAEDIGRSLQRMPSGRISFVQRLARTGGPPELTIMQLAVPMKPADDPRPTTSAVARPVTGATEPYPVWMPDGTALMAHGNVLYARRPADTDWTSVADLASFGLNTVTRLALSPKGDRLALVAAGN